MRIHILSDIHLEEHAYAPEPTDADVVVLAGDIGVGIEGVLWAKEHFQVPVIYVAGNHEYHDPTFSMDEHKEMMKQVADGSNVVVLDNEAIEIDGVKFLGSTMWTEPKNEGAVLTCDAERIAVHGDDDDGLESFTSRDQARLHQDSRQWLEAELAEAYEGKSVVVTHHAPSIKSLASRYVGYPMNDCYVAKNTEALIHGTDLWVHGHTHHSSDYVIGESRVLCNPHGYQNQHGVPDDSAFDPAKVIVI